MDKPPRRRRDDKLRSNRLKAGSVSTPIAILVAYGVGETIGPMPQEVTIALSAVVGSVVTGATMCFWDLRDVFMRCLVYRKWIRPRARKQDHADEND